MSKSGSVRFGKVVIDRLDPAFLSAFYMKLLGWEKGFERDDFVIIFSEACNVNIGFQKNPDYVSPRWPEESKEQQQMLHLDFAVAEDERQGWVDYVVSCGARIADMQYSDQWTVMLDPEGHPFCIDPT